MKNEFNIYAIHGFLGRPSDWDFLEEDIFAQNILSIDLFDPVRPIRGLWDWAHRFNHTIAHPPEALNILIGYSLGGRLGIHALLDDPTHWDAAIFISTHTGLKSEEEREERRKKDAAWAISFSSEEESWDELMQKWNGQNAFKNCLPLKREEKEYSRQKLASALIAWSLGRQDNLAQPLAKVNIPILWIAGENDPVYSELSRSLSLSHPLSQVKIIPDASHRIPFENRQELQKLTSSFLKTIQVGPYANASSLA